MANTISEQAGEKKPKHPTVSVSARALVAMNFVIVVVFGLIGVSYHFMAHVGWAIPTLSNIGMVIVCLWWILYLKPKARQT